MLVILLACALAGALVAAAVFAAPSRRAQPMKLACAWAESGLLRYAAHRSDCHRSTEKVVSIAAEAPVYACVSGRYQLSRRAGEHPRGTVIPLGTMWRAPRAGYCRLLHQREISLGGPVVVHLCAAPDGLLRYVHAARRCRGSERELFVPARRHRHPRLVGTPPPGHPVVPPGHPVVPPPSNPPTAYPQTLSDDEGVPLAITLTGAANPPGEPVSYEIVSAPAHGALTGVPPSVTYTPAAGYHGSDSFTFTVSDGKRTSAPATVSITVNHVVDSSPVNGVPGEQSLAENGSLTFSSLDTNQISVSDSDSEGGVEQVKLSVAHGSLSPGSTSGLSAHSGDGTGTLTLEGTIEALDGALEGLVYTPAHDFHGSDSLSVETDDLGHTGQGGPLTAVSNVPIAVSAVTYDTAVADSYSTNQNVTLSVATGRGVLANDTDADTPPLPLSAEVVSGPTHGALTLNADGSFEYVPTHDFSGTDSFSYRDSDGNTPSNVATVTLTVNKVTYDTAVNDSYSLNENTTLGKSAGEGLLANDTDADTPPLPLSAEVVSGPTHGALTLNADGSFEYVPTHDFSGTDSFTYRDSDGNTPSNVATVSLSIEHVDRAPVNSVPGEQSLEENGSLMFSSSHTNQIFVSDSDSEGGVEQVKLAVAHGTLTLGRTSGLESVVGNESSQVTARGTVAALGEALDGLVYTPTHDFNGSDSLSVETDDLGHTGVGGPLTDVSSVPLTVSVVAYDTAVADSYTTNENETLSKVAASGVLANDSDSDALPLEAVLVSGPSHGALTLNADGSFEYVPAHNYSGSDSFTYKDYDGNTFSNTVTVTISVEPVTYDTAIADSYTASENATLSKTAATGVLANDTETDSPALPLTAVLVSGPSHGALTLNADGSFEYVPTHNFHGTDSFTYKDNDGNTDSNTVTVSLTVEPVTYDTAVADSYSLNENEALSRSASNGVLSNDTESDSPALPLTAVLVSGPSHGALTLNADGSFEYVPAHNYSGSDSFTYKDYDGNTFSNTVTVTISVEPVTYDTAIADSYTASENATLSKTAATGVLANDTETDSPALPLTAVLVSGPSHGALTLNADGSFEYVPTHNFHGTDSFTYKDNDGNTDSNTVTVTLAVEPVVYDAAAADSYTAHENQTLSEAAIEGVLANDTDTDSPALPLEAVLVSGPSHGTLTLKSDGSFEYTPSHNYVGADSFTYRDNDGNTFSNTVTVSLTVEPVTYDTAVADSYTASENGTLSKTAATGVLANDTDSDTPALPLEAVLVSGPSHGSLTLKSDGSFEYTPSHNYVGADSFTYKDNDGNTFSNTVTVSLTVEPVTYDTATADSYTTHENTTLSETAATGVLANDTDSDTPALPLEAVLASGPSHGTLTLNADGSFEYVPSSGFHGTDSFTYKDNDGNTFSNTATVTITVGHVDEAPQVTLGASSESVGGGETVTFSKAGSDAIVVSDADSEGEVERVTLKASHGTLQPGTVAGLSTHTGEGTGVLTLEGTISALNTALEGSTYTASSGYGGADTLTVEVDDLGHSGLEGPKTASGAIEITVLHTDEAPALTAPAEAKAIENTSGEKTSVVFSKANSNQIAMSDKDAEGGVEKLELAVSHGTLTPHSASGLTVTGSGTASLKIEGTLTAIAEGLEGLTYVPTLEYTGSDALSLTANDLGHSGSGGPKTASASVSITVTAPNPTPINPTFTGAVGNTELSVGVARGAAPDVEKTGSVLPSPAEGPDKSSLAVTAETIKTAHEGTVSMNANGTFTYQPPVGLHAGTDTFQYNETDSLGGKATGTATIEFNGHRVWYAKSQEAEAGNGESNKPFKSLSSAEAASASGDVIFLENSSSAYSGGIKLKSEQTLAGQDKELNLAEEEIVPASGVYPIVEKPGSVVVAVESADTVNGVEVKASENDGIAGTGLSGAVTISNDTILGNKTSSKGSGINLAPASTGTLTLDLANNTISGQHVWGISLVAGPGATVNGTIAHNTIGERTVEGSGSQDGGAINVLAEGKSDTTTVEVSENTVLSIDGEGVGMRMEAKEEAIAKSFGAVLNATVLNNTVEMIDEKSSEGLYFEAGNEGSPNGETLCLNAKGNTIKAAGREGPAAFNADAILLDVQTNSTFKVHGVTGGGSNTEVAKLLEAENKLSTLFGEELVFIEAHKTFSSGTCPVP